MKKVNISDIFQHSPTPTSIVEAKGPGFKFIKVNRAYCRMTQRTENELIGKALFDAFPANPNEKKPTGPQRLLESFRKVVETKKEDELGTIRYDIVLDDGNFKEVYWKVINTPILDEDGNVDHIINSANRITEQVISQRINKMMLDNSEDSFILIDKDLNIKNFNRRFADNYLEIFGKEVQVGQSILDLTQPERRIYLKEIYERVLKGETIQNILPVGTKNGDTRYFDILYKPALDENDEIVGSFVSLIEKTTEREAQEKYRQVVEHSTNMFFKHDENGLLTYVSPQSKYFLGYSPEESMRKWTDFITNHPINKEGEINTLKALETGEAQPPYELQLRTGDDRVIWVEIHEAPIVEDGEVTGVVGSLSDITERKNYEEQLQKSLERYDYASKATRDAIYDWDIVKDNLHWGEGFNSLFGYDGGKNPYSLKEWSEYVHPADLEDVQKKLYRTLNDTNLNQVEYEYRFRKQNGDYAYVLEKGYVIRNDDGLAIRMIGALRDITESKQAKIDLEKAFKEKAGILESIKDAFFAVDKNWKVTYWNKEAENVLYKPREDIIGKNLWVEFEDAKELEFYRQYHKAVEEQVTVNFEEYYPGVEKWFEVSAYPSPDGLSVYFKDITERKKARKALEKLNKELEDRARELAASNAELEQFAYVASHDLQEPLRMITSFLSQLENKYSNELDEKANQYIHFAVDGAHRMRQIILDLLNYSKLNREKNKREKVDSKTIIKEVEAIERSHIDKTGAEIISNNLPVIYANPGPIKQVFQNLINNALKYHNPENSPVVQISCSETDTHWKFEVEDNGIGIKKEFQETIFQIFQRLHTRDQYKGTGIGLAISRKIIERHGGEIWLNSEEGFGSTFYFTISKVQST